ncbi:sugar phosphatase [Erwinia sp. OLTSP20]|uniref:sugar phosphatase n=1 Tax=unclassified Erwinia TaxID=2622719 RepID=UPI000C1A73A4|nr:MULTISPECIES: sugar phosphatase [unclassified Erwinia]PIJ51490.1 sugar phosphatase [Erwinia sp. OAMSP11]PIJ68620.1 sugar phosphatase [Erwinia sp. OLSSP12]PIJ83399.1 sugar phosphatase [Erwinia sp. OLCASP19]PIJ86232.1 sugar phosphatase [Erwinia sp. OLMTSP26]PIJ88525.1 sugar phosphatase [Erwinia sp. OLMDSP33]
MKCSGFLFDLDGTLVDSLPAVERAWVEWGARQGIDANTIVNFVHGKKAITSVRHFMQGASESQIQQEFLQLEKREAEDTDGIIALPGAHQLLSRLDELQIPWAIVTSGSMPVATARLRAAGLATPAVFITAERVERGKPEPDPYLLGAQLLGLEPEECLVIEDASAGILSGLAAGCHVVAVNPPADVQRLEAIDLVLNSLEEMVINLDSEGRISVHRRH